MIHPGNHILKKDAAFSSNFYKSDGILKHYLKKYTAPDSFEYMNGKLDSIGRDAAIVMDALSLDAGKHGPELIKRTPYGEDLDHIHFHPSYWLLPKLSSRKGEGLFTGAMFLTEKAGGSDVGSNRTTTESLEENLYKLNGKNGFAATPTPM